MKKKLFLLISLIVTNVSTMPLDFSFKTIEVSGIRVQVLAGIGKGKLYQQNVELGVQWSINSALSGRSVSDEAIGDELDLHKETDSDSARRSRMNGLIDGRLAAKRVLHDKKIQE